MRTPIQIIELVKLVEKLKKMFFGQTSYKIESIKFHFMVNVPRIILTTSSQHNLHAVIFTISVPGVRLFIF